VTGLLAQGGADAVAVVLVGDELLLGSVADTNGAWLARTVAAHGLRMVSVQVVPDEVGRISEAVHRVAGTVGTVVLSGGIGPTSDDLTREALARACGCALVPDESARQAIRAWFAARGRGVPTTAWRMAQRPQCAAMVVNQSGSAPGVALELDGSWVVALPGVPSELRAMVGSTVLPQALARAGDRPPTVSTCLEVALLGESAVAARLADLEAAVRDDASVDVAYLARPAHVSVRLSVRGESLERSQRRVEALAAQARDALGPDVVGVDGASGAGVVLAELTTRRQTLACAESLTGGQVSADLTAVPGASLVLRGAVVTYATELKQTLAAVPTHLLEQQGPVDLQVALAMAQGVRARLGADWGLATTGVAGPDPVGVHPPGEVYVAVCGPDSHRVRSLRLPGDRERVRRLAAAHAVDLLRRAVFGLPEPSERFGESVGEAPG
jgi:nicotinamide-nucleotide amidase